MKETILNLAERVLPGSSEWTREEILWGAVFIGLIFAMLELVIMMATRWGERRTTPKSLFFSLLVHLSCASGLVAVNPLSVSGPPGDETLGPILLQSNIVEEIHLNPETPSSPPIWDQAAEPIQTQIARFEHQPPEPQPPEAADRAEQSLAPPDVQVTEVAPRPEEKTAEPKPEEVADSYPLQEATTTLNVDEQTAPESRREAGATPSNVRGTASRPEQAVANVNPDRQSVAGEPAAGLSGNDIELPKEGTATSADVDPKNFVTRSPDSDTRQQQPAEPTAAEVAGSEPGKNVAESAAPVGTANPNAVARRVARSSNTASDGDDATLKPVRPVPGFAHGDEAYDVRIAARETGPGDALSPGGAKPDVQRPQIDLNPGARPAGVPSTYRLRNIERRGESAQKFGGTDDSEKAVEASLRWLASVQTADGYWDSDAHGGGNVVPDASGKDERGVNISDGIPGKKADSGVTALAILAFLGAGYTHEEGQYAEAVDRALQWLARNQREDGFLGGDATYYESMYCHAMATYAMAEAYGMQSDATAETGLRKPLVRAVNYILSNQNPDGGWRYRKGQQSDMSMFGWQLMALKSADIAGIRIPKVNIADMQKFLSSRSMGTRKGLAGYAVSLNSGQPMPPTPTMTAEALFCKQMLGIERSDPASDEAIQYLLQRIPRRSQTNHYYWYYGTLAMYQYGGKPWQQWNEAIREELISTQVVTGNQAGSWEPRGPWGDYGGRIYSTALCTLCLEVYYRFLPLYNMGGQYENVDAR